MRAGQTPDGFEGHHQSPDLQRMRDSLQQRLASANEGTLNLVNTLLTLNADAQRNLHELLSGKRQQTAKLTGELIHSGPYQGEERARQLLQVSRMVSNGVPGMHALLAALTDPHREEQKAFLMEQVANMPISATDELSEEDGERFFKVFQAEDRKNFLDQLVDKQTSTTVTKADIQFLAKQRNAKSPFDYFHYFEGRLQGRSPLTLKEIQAKAKAGNVSCKPKALYREEQREGAGYAIPTFLISSDGYRVVVRTAESFDAEIWYDDSEQV